MQRVRRGGTPIKHRDAVALRLREPRVRDAPSLERLGEQLREQAEGLLALANELQKLVGEKACGTPCPNLYFGDPTALVVFQRQGEYWAVTFTGKTVHLRHRLGFTYLEKLISTPGKSWPCLELIGYALGETRALSPGLTQCRQETCSTLHRLREQWRSLGEQLEEADRNQDLGRRAALAAQREQLKSYMLEVLRGPHTGAERARVAVHKAIRRALAAVEVEHPGLAAYLTQSRAPRGHVFVFALRRCASVANDSAGRHAVRQDARPRRNVGVERWKGRLRRGNPGGCLGVAFDSVGQAQGLPGVRP